MTVQTALDTYIRESGETMRALSLRAHLNPKAVSDILSIPGLRPRRKSLVALSEATGIDLVAASGFETITYAALLNRLDEQGYTALRSRVRTILRKGELDGRDETCLPSRRDRLFRDAQCGQPRRDARNLRDIQERCPEGAGCRPGAPARPQCLRYRRRARCSA